MCSCLAATTRCILKKVQGIYNLSLWDQFDPSHDLLSCLERYYLLVNTIKATCSLHADVHIGEAAFTLGRNVEFEIPYLRAQMLKHQQQLMDHEKKQADYLRSAANAQTQYTQVELRRWPRSQQAYDYITVGCGEGSLCCAS